uniref:Histone deacetylase n=1 Tax=Opuntia streptacantha TaxID=393608 RepID=A0A7C9DMB9_OPUST
MMQFWGVEVKNGGSVKVQPGDDKVVHLSQACLGEVKKDKGSEFVRLFAQKDGQKFVIGILSLEKFPHINLDLVFEDEFELSHDWKHGSVHFAGYKADNPDPMLDGDESDDDLEEPVPVNALNNGKSETKELKASGNKANASVKPENAEAKPKVRIVEPGKDVKKNEDDDETDDDDDDEDDDEESDEEAEEEDEDVPIAEVGSDDEDDSDEEEESDEETPKKPEPSKKRPGESTSKTPIPDKKAKLATPQQKADGKKVSGHVATPHPAKQVAKTPANAGKSNKQTSKSGGSFACSSCTRTFGSEQALQSHSKAKHGAK